MEHLEQLPAITSLTVLVGLHLVWQVAKFWLGEFKKKSEASDKALEGFGTLNVRLMAIERDMNEMLKMRQDFRRIFTALKTLAGDKWPDVRKAVLEDDLSGIKHD